MTYDEMRKLPMSDLIDRRIVVEKAIQKVQAVYQRAAEFELRDQREELKLIRYAMHALSMLGETK